MEFPRRLSDLLLSQFGIIPNGEIRPDALGIEV
jgi:hypothetical protein